MTVQNQNQQGETQPQDATGEATPVSPAKKTVRGAGDLTPGRRARSHDLLSGRRQRRHRRAEKARGLVTETVRFAGCEGQRAQPATG